jgi:hypothetical protein
MSGTRIRWALGALACLALTASQASAANLFANPGFEDPVTSDGPPFVGSWEAFNGGAGSSSTNSTVTPRSGLQDLNVAISNTDNTFAGAFQDVPSLIPGQSVDFSGFHMSPSSPLDLTIEVRIEWRNSVSNTEVSRTPNLSPPIGSTYVPFLLSSTVPVGADTARAVYAIQTFSGGPTNNGSVFVDDVSFEVIPEPTTAALLGLVAFGGAALGRRSRLLK